MLPLTILPEYIVKLLTGTDQRSKEFRNMIRTYNNYFTYTSVGMHSNEHYEYRDHGIYTVKVQRLGASLLRRFDKMTSLLFYFYDPQHQVSNRMAALPRLDETVVGGLVTVMNENQYSLFNIIMHVMIHYNTSCCKPANPSSLFNKFYEFMAEDFVRIKNQMHLSENDVLQKVLQGINDTLESLGRDINEFKLVSFQYVPNEYEKLTREIASEKNIPVSDEHLRGIHKLNSQQKIAFDTIYSVAMSDRGGVFFVDGLGGTGKSFLYTILLAHIRSKGYIALIVASSGIASSNFLGGRRSH